MDRLASLECSKKVLSEPAWRVNSETGRPRAGGAVRYSVCLSESGTQDATRRQGHPVELLPAAAEGRLEFVEILHRSGVRAGLVLYMTLRRAVASEQRTSPCVPGRDLRPLLGWQSKGREGDAMPTATVAPVRGIPPFGSVGGRPEAIVALDGAGTAVRSAVVHPRIPRGLGKLLGPRALPAEPRGRGPPNRVAFVT
jgi:hypothetical protein